MVALDDRNLEAFDVCFDWFNQVELSLILFGFQVGYRVGSSEGIASDLFQDSYFQP